MICFCVWMLCAGQPLSAQQNPPMAAAIPVDTLSLSIRDCEALFTDKNPSIMAAKFDLQVADAAVITARLFDNPTFSYSSSLHSPRSNKYLDNSISTGHVDVIVQQTFAIAGRRMNGIKLSRILKERTEYSFRELMRELGYQMYTSAYLIYQDEQKIRLYNNLILNFERLINAAQQENNLGVLARNEVIRLQAEMQSNRNELLAVYSESFQAQNTLKTLLGVRPQVYLKIIMPESRPQINLPPLADVINKATAERPDILYSNKTVEAGERNLKLQNSLKYPDLGIFGEYDNNGNAYNNYVGLGISLGLPFFSRNQGNVSEAQLLNTRNRILDTLQINTAQNEIVQAYLQLSRAQLEYQRIDNTYISNLEGLQSNALMNYNRHYISLLEFLDQIRTYISARRGVIETQYGYFNAINYLNFTSGQRLN